jgi:hypothetical protein
VDALLQFEHLLQLVSDPLVPDVHWNALLNDLAVEWLGIDVQELLAILLYLHRLGSLHKGRVTNT